MFTGWWDGGCSGDGACDLKNGDSCSAVVPSGVPSRPPSDVSSNGRGGGGGTANLLSNPICSAGKSSVPSQPTSLHISSDQY